MEPRQLTIRPSRPSRKRCITDQSSANSASLHTPNLKYEFLTKEDGGLISQLRSQQLNDLLQFLKSHCQPLQQKNDCRIILNIGPPGTGKTSVVRQAIDRLRNSLPGQTKQTLSLHSLEVVTFNAHSISKCQELKNLLMKTLGDGTSKLQVREIQLNHRGKLIITIIVAEEVDKLVEESSSESLHHFIDTILYSQTSPTNQQGQDCPKMRKFLLVGTSNAINLQQVLIKKAGQRKVHAILYPPYSAQSLVKIAHARVEAIRQKLKIELKIPEKLLKFVVMKLRDANRDDTRNLIEAIKEIMIFAEANKQVQEALARDEVAIIQISMENINNIPKLNKMLSCCKAELIQKLNFKQQLLLGLMCAYLKKNGALEIPFLQVVEQFKKSQKTFGIKAYEDVTTAINELETFGCVEVRNRSGSKGLSKSGQAKSVLMKVSMTDIESGLSANPILCRYLEDAQS